MCGGGGVTAATVQLPFVFPSSSSTHFQHYYSEKKTKEGCKSKYFKGMACYKIELVMVVFGNSGNEINSWVRERELLCMSSYNNNNDNNEMGNVSFVMIIIIKTMKTTTMMTNIEWKCTWMNECLRNATTTRIAAVESWYTWKRKFSLLIFKFSLFTTNQHDFHCHYYL